MKDKENQIFDKYGNYDFPTEIKQEGLNNATTQIEEMAKLIDDRLIEARGYLGSMNKGEGFWIAQKLIERYQPKIPEDSVVLSREELIEKYVPIDTFVLIKEELEFVKRRLKIKTDEADWRASQLQALDKDFELMEKVCKCKDCKWLEEKHYEEDNEKPYIKLVCKLTKRQCRLYDFCSYGEKKL